MNVINSQLEVLKKAVDILSGEARVTRGEKEKAIAEAQLVMKALEAKRERDNARTWKYILEKRKKDKDYARSASTRERHKKFGVQKYTKKEER